MEDLECKKFVKIKVQLLFIIIHHQFLIMIKVYHEISSIYREVKIHISVINCGVCGT
jgi:hypothetical protein